MTIKMFQLIITKKDEGRSLGNYLKKELKLPTSFIHKLLRKHKIKINGLKPDLNWKLKENYELKIFADLAESKRENLKIPQQFYKKHLRIIFENEDLIVINKRSDISVQPTKNIHYSKTLAGIVDYYGQEKDTKTYLIHRLDKDTSGIVIFAKNPQIRQNLHSLFEKRLINKTYLGLIKGIIKHRGTINTQIPDNKGNIVSALTKYEVIDTFQNISFMRIYPLTGRFHQIRKHFQHIGHPIIMDELYGDFNYNKKFRTEFGLKRQFLHAESIEFNLFSTTWKFHAPLDEDLKKVLGKLKE